MTFIKIEYASNYVSGEIANKTKRIRAQVLIDSWLIALQATTILCSSANMKSDNSEKEREIVRLPSEKGESDFEETWESEDTESESVQQRPAWRPNPKET